ncbi:MAG: long-chain acyl-CoA synthetase, partial [Mycobacterium sp.]|nr:long-chain acyl-CoA synthetase [Mycobacterium sp.]
VQGQGVAVRASPTPSGRGGRTDRRRRNHVDQLVNLADHAIAAPESPALIRSDGGVISFGELYAKSQRVAAVLHSAGLRRGDGVALVLPNRPEFFEITWGCQLSGLYYTAVNTHFTPDEVAYVIEDSDAKAVFVDASMGDLAAHLRTTNAAVDVHFAVGGNLVGWQSFDDAVTRAGDAPPLSDGSEMLYSSGTTGRPKAVRRPLPTDGNGSWAQAVLEMALTHKYGMSQASVYLSPAPLYHAAGVNYTMAVNRVGAAAIIMRKFDAEAVLRLIETYRVTHAQFVPTMFVRMLKLPEAVRQKYDVSSLRCVIHAAAPCPVDVKHQMMKWFGPIIHEYYGGTEGFAGTTIGPEEWLTHPGSVGIPMSPVHVVGDDGEELPIGQRGELYFEGGPKFEYFKDPAKTASVSNEHGWRSLGDMGYVDEDGYLYLTDRSTFMIVSGGVNIYPQEAENLLVMHPKLVDAAVFGVPNEEFGEEVKAVVQPVDGVTPGPDLEAELIEYCRTHLAGYKCPRTVEFELELPRDPNGKLYKRHIRERYWQGRSSRIV